MSLERRKLAVEEGKYDIISGLPRHVLDEIFERLPVKDAARTCILSRKWRYIWSKYPNLMFDQEFYLLNIANNPRFGSKYVDVINKVLLLHEGPVLKFSLYVPNVFFGWDEHINQWLLFVSRNGIRELKLIYVSIFIPFILPSYVFECPDLTNLELVNCIFKPPDLFCGFANLVSASFKRVEFETYTFADRSPVSPFLSTLTFTSCCGVENFKIYAPQLKQLELNSSHDVTSTFLGNFPNLVNILIAAGGFMKVVYPTKAPLHMFSRLHEKFPRIEVFSFDGYFLKLSAPTTNQTRPSLAFQFLTNLVLYFLSSDDLDQILCVRWLLNSTPSLQKLVLSFLQVSSSEGTASESISRVSTHLESSDCVSEMLNLRTLELEYVGESKPEMLLIKCIIAHSPNLKHVRVKCTGRDQAFRIRNELENFGRALGNDKIIFGIFAD